MAHSMVVSRMKEEAVKQLLNCDLFIDALDAQDVKDKKDLVGTHIFTYPLNPEFITDPITFVTISVRIPKEYRNNKIWAYPILQMHIVSHVKHMKIDTKQIKTCTNRNDFISQVLDHLLNTKETSKRRFGFFGQLELVKNEEGVFNKDWLFRYMEFETMDLDRALCECETKEFFGQYGYKVPFAECEEE